MAEVAEQYTFYTDSYSKGDVTRISHQELDSRCYDWIVVKGSSHYACDREVFKTYRPIRASAGGMIVKGIGSVELEVLTGRSGSKSKKLVLKHVLHIPTALCNGFNRHSGESSNWHIRDFQGLERLELAGSPQGRSPLLEIGGIESHMLSLYLSQDEAEELGRFYKK